MKINNILLMFIIVLNVINAGCGGCGTNINHISNELKKNSNKVNSLITSVPKDGKVEGIIITSCGICNLGVKRGGCSLSVKIDDKVYSVEGTKIHEHGDEHSSEGFCSTIRVAWVKRLELQPL